MKPKRRVSDQGYELIKKWEGFEPSWYSDGAGVDTIGYGTTRPFAEKVKVKLEAPITKEEGEIAMRATVGQYMEPAIDKAIHGFIRQEELDALASFTYNVGRSAFAKSSLAKRINRDDPRAYEELLKWVYVTKPSGEKVVSKGLLARREDEKRLAEEEPRVDVPKATKVESCPPEKLTPEVDIDFSKLQIDA